MSTEEGGGAHQVQQESDRLEKQELQEWAYEATRGANNWLVTIRNATDEGYEAWSDFYTQDGDLSSGDEDTGLMSYSEGISAISLTNAYAAADNEWLSLQEGLFHQDLDFILKQVEEEGGNYSPEPYLKGDTDSFTEAVSFSTSALVGALNSNIWNRDVISRGRIENAIEKNVNYLLESQLEESPPDEEVSWDGAGWAWNGHDSEYSFSAPTKYFTYSMSIALADLIREDQQQDAVDDELRGEIVEALGKAKRFLLDSYTVNEDDEDNRLYWLNEYEEYDGPHDLATTYTVAAVCFMTEVPEIKLSKDEQIKLREAVDYVLNDSNLMRSLANLAKKTTDYSTPLGNFTDGSAPYVVLYMLMVVRDTLGWSNLETDDETVEMRRNELCQEILDRCWAGSSGTDGFPNKGFRHFQEILENKLPSGDSSVTVIYTTGAAIEPLLRFELEKPTADTGRTGTGGSDETGPSPLTVQGDLVNITLGDGVDKSTVDMQQATDFRQALSEFQESLQETVREALKESSSSRSGDDMSGELISVLEDRNQNVVDEHFDVSEIASNDLKESVKNIGKQITDEIGKKTWDAYEDNFRSPNHLYTTHADKFVDMIVPCLFTSDPKKIEEQVSNTRKLSLLKPWQELLDDLEGLDDQAIRQGDHKEIIHNRLTELRNLDEREFDEGKLKQMLPENSSSGEGE